MIPRLAFGYGLKSFNLYPPSKIVYVANLRYYLGAVAPSHISLSGHFNCRLRYRRSYQIILGLSLTSSKLRGKRCRAGKVKKKVATILQMSHQPSDCLPNA
jgi:hypothetical protein